MDLQSYFDVSQARDLAALKQRMIGFAHEMDFPLAGAVLVTAPADSEPVLRYVGNRPPGFVIADDTELVKKDPVLAILRRQGLPFTYDQKFYVDAGVPELWEMAAPFGYRTGLSVALRLTGGHQLLLGLDREQALPKSGMRVADMLSRLLMLAVHCQEAVLRFLGPRSNADSLPKLSERELEVLRWTMAGKSAWDTGMILGISERTANFHIQSATRKLRCASKHQAVLLAFRLGLIG